MHEHSGTSFDRTASGAIGVVVIGRNEGERLRRCLESISGLARHIVYVDSGSTDGSVSMSRALGVAIAELDIRVPFTAARARNAGFYELLMRQPQLEYVFFVDGDCEIVEGWMEKAGQFLSRYPDFAVVWGRRRERFPEKSIYNMLCDIEWDVEVGESRICGGDAVVRVQAFREIGGYRPDLICGEEPEMCVRLRKVGWRICRLGAEMTLHDAAIYRFSQWWQRMMRGGYAFAMGNALHGAPPERHFVVESRRAWVWGLLFPIGVLILTSVFGFWALLLLNIYLLQFVRIALLGTRTTRENWWWAAAMVVGKFPEMFGQMKFLLDRIRRVKSRLIEYK
jgi:GT2 family glycosyltransferase